MSEICEAFFMKKQIIFYFMAAGGCCWSDSDTFKLSGIENDPSLLNCNICIKSGESDADDLE